jgi:hypothetical protein
VGHGSIWKTAGLSYAPSIRHFPDAVASDMSVSLEEASARYRMENPAAWTWWVSRRNSTKPATCGLPT